MKAFGANSSVGRGEEGGGKGGEVGLLAVWGCCCGCGCGGPRGIFAVGGGWMKTLCCPCPWCACAPVDCLFFAPFSPSIIVLGVFPFEEAPYFSINSCVESYLVALFNFSIVSSLSRPSSSRYTLFLPIQYSYQLVTARLTPHNTMGPPETIVYSKAPHSRQPVTRMNMRTVRIYVKPP